MHKGNPVFLFALQELREKQLFILELRIFLREAERRCELLLLRIKWMVLEGRLTFGFCVCFFDAIGDGKLFLFVASRIVSRAIMILFARTRPCDRLFGRFHGFTIYSLLHFNDIFIGYI